MNNKLSGLRDKSRGLRLKSRGIYYEHAHLDHVDCKFHNVNCYSRFKDEPPHHVGGSPRRVHARTCPEDGYLHNKSRGIYYEHAHLDHVDCKFHNVNCYSRFKDEPPHHVGGSPRCVHARTCPGDDHLHHKSRVICDATRVIYHGIHQINPSTCLICNRFSEISFITYVF